MNHSALTRACRGSPAAASGQQAEDAPRRRTPRAAPRRPPRRALCGSGSASGQRDAARERRGQRRTSMRSASPAGCAAARGAASASAERRASAADRGRRRGVDDVRRAAEHERGSRAPSTSAPRDARASRRGRAQRERVAAPRRPRQRARAAPPPREGARSRSRERRARELVGRAATSESGAERAAPSRRRSTSRLRGRCARAREALERHHRRADEEQRHRVDAERERDDQRERDAAARRGQHVPEHRAGSSITPPRRSRAACAGTRSPRAGSARRHSIITSRSTPMPSPPVGGSPTSSAAQVVLVERVRLVVAGRAARAALAEQALALVVRIVQLAEGVADLHAAEERLEALDQARVVGRALGERRELDRVVDDEGRAGSASARRAR